MNRRGRRFLLIFLSTWIIFILSKGKTYRDTTLDTPNQRVLLLTAHPDDECMFFTPTITALVRRGVAMFSLCLSIGNADRLGETRSSELRKSLQVLGIPSHHSEVVNHPNLQDNITQLWNPEIIARVVRPFIHTHNISLILTFDQHGISNHPNHISLPAGIRHLMRDPQDQHLRLFTLKTVPMLPKYIGPFSHIVAKLWSSIVQTPKHPTFVAGFKDYQTALQAMYQHWSQLVWFRWLYVLFSRYMWVNEWVPVHVA